MEQKPQTELSFSWSELTTPPVEYEFGYQLDSVEIIHRPPIESAYDFDMSEFIIRMAINSAIYLKQTSIPARLTDLTETTVKVGSVMEEHLQLKRKIKIVGHAFVSAIVNVCTTFIAAILQFIIAYHNAPGLDKKNNQNQNQIKGDLDLTATFVTFCVGGIVFKTESRRIIENQETYLARLVLSRDDPSEPIFIDRDGTHFRHILNHFRGVDSVVHVKDSQVLADLIEECKFYGLREMIILIKTLQEQLAADSLRIGRSRSRNRSNSRSSSQSITRYESNSDGQLSEPDTLKPYSI